MNLKLILFYILKKINKKSNQPNQSKLIDWFGLVFQTTLNQSKLN